MDTRQVPDDFYEGDEPAEEIRAAFDDGVKGVTGDFDGTHDPVRFHIHVTSTCPGVTCACLRRGENIA